ncbi:MAG: AIPR family protein, partial [Acidobacteriaceae bacterium]
RFANHLVISRDYPGDLELEEICVGGGGDFGIDGIAIVVNDHVVSSTEAVSYWKSQLKRFDVRFIFIQAKTSAGFDAGEMGKFFFGVRSFFDPQIQIANESVRRAREISNYIYDATGDMNEAPRCDLHYVSLGKWTGDPFLKQRADAEIRLLQDTQLFAEVHFSPWDAEGVKSVYRELERKVVKEIIFERHTSLPTINGVEQAYIGVIPASEYLKLICDSDGRLQRSLFYDNVRDFLGNNPVNEDISQTLAQNTLHDNFTILNNGITIVARSLNQVGPKFKLSDFQIVNGCQTSHVLHKFRANVQTVFVPIKLVITEDQDVTNRVIKATNWQTEVKEEAFESLKLFQKELEEFYRTVEVPARCRLYYERRSRQYDFESVDHKRVISMTAQIKSFIAMFLNEPHSTHRYYGELLESNRQRLFMQDHSPFPYYIAGLALHTLGDLMGKGAIHRSYYKYRFQLLMLFRLLAESEPMPYLNNKKIVAYCGHLLEELDDPQKAKTIFSNATRILDKQVADSRYAAEGERMRAFTLLLCEAAKPGKELPAPLHRERGFVVKFSAVKGYGFIRSDERKNDVFVHYSGIRGAGYRTLNEGDLVEFTAETAADGHLKAVDVTRTHDENQG